MKKGIVGKFLVWGALASLVVLAAPASTFAHVVVKPSEALTGAYQTFTTSVPNEKDIPVTGVRLVVPDAVESITPTVKQGWNIETKKDGEKVTEISWTGGTIAPELRDEFTFSAHLPAEAGDIHWKAYQTYQDGSVVAWDQKPAEDQGHESADESKGPYSTTVVSDEANEADEAQSSLNVLPYVISVVALGLAVFALVRTTWKQAFRSIRTTHPIMLCLKRTY